MTSANALLVRLETGADVAYVVGGALIAALPIAASFYVDALTFGVSALAISAMRIPSPRAALEQTLAGVARRIRDGLQYLLSQPFLKWSTISSIPAPICVGGVFVLSPLYASAVLVHSGGLAGPLRNGAFRFSVLEVAIGLGGLIGTVVAPRLANRLPRGAVFASGMTGFGVVIALLAFISNMYVAAVVMALSGLSNSLVQVAGSTLLQALTPSEMRGRVLAARITIIQTGLGVGAALAGWLLVWLPVHTIWLVLATLMLCAAALAWWNPDARRQA
jgi:predicted MFS family arabinose efflux permease